MTDNAQLIASLDRLSEVTERLIELRSATIEEVRELAGTKAQAKPKAAPKPAEPKAEAPAKEEASEAKAEAPAAEKVGGVRDSLQEVAKVTGEYMKGSDRPEERTARGEKVKRVLDALKAKTIGDLTEASEGKFLETIKALIAKGDLTEPPAAEEDGGSDLDALLNI